MTPTKHVLDYSYYPGCSLHASAKEYDESTQGLFKALKIEGDKVRVVPINETVANAIHAYLIKDGRLAKTEESPMFMDDVFGTPMTVRQVQQVVYRRAKSLGLKGVNAHSLRHHYATRLIRAGAAPFSVQKLLGHESISTTQVYVNLDISDTTKAARLDTMA